MSVTLEKKLQFYKQMWRIRTFEETARVAFLNGKFQGFLHVGIGEEASMVGITSSLREEDYISSTHRGHGVTLTKGAESKKMMAELAGRSTGLCKGFGGSQHMGDVTKGIIGSNGILGASLPIMAGVALAQKIRGTKNVSIAYFGDGTSNEGAVHEAMNFAAAKNLPIVFTCVNNMYGMWTSYADASKNKNVADRAAGYGIPGVIVDGNDVIAAYDAVSKAVEHARNGYGPTLVELKTYRWFDHSIGLREEFRSKDELEQWKEKCPINKLKQKLLIDDGIDESQLVNIEKEVSVEMNEALEFALNSSFPKEEDLIDSVYTNMKVGVNKV